VGIEIPLLRKALFTAASFAFAISLGEFGATLVLQNPKYATLPVAIFDRLGRPGLANYEAALALTFVLMVVAFLVMSLLERLEH
jgi:thiamine transport system permease protein